MDYHKEIQDLMIFAEEAHHLKYVSTGELRSLMQSRR
jgi:hypothetical protein